jgi:hypothetical protein
MQLGGIPGSGRSRLLAKICQLIRSKDVLWLAIPLPDASKSLRGRRITPGEWERRRWVRLRSVYRRTGASLKRKAKHEGPSGLVPLQDQARQSHSADLPTGPAGETAGASLIGTR